MHYQRSQHKSSGDSSLAEGFTKLTIGLIVAGVTLMSRCESGQDAQRKSLMIDEMLNDSAKICSVKIVEKPELTYRQRLNGVLSDTLNTKLDVISEHKVTICLDTRLSEQNLGILGHLEMSPKIWGIYYPSLKRVQIMDNGSDMGDLFSPDGAGDYGVETVEAFADALKKGKIDPQQISYARVEEGGEYTPDKIVWAAARDFDKAAQQRNMHLSVPPPLPITFDLESFNTHPVRRPRGRIDDEADIPIQAPVTGVVDGMHCNAA